MRKLLVVAVTMLVVIGMYCYIFNVNIRGKEVIGHQDDGKEPICADALSTVEAPPTKTDVVSKDLSLDSQADAPTPKPQISVPHGWQLVWKDEFDHAQLNTDFWTNVERKDNYNEELQYYLPENAYVKDGYLLLEAKAEKLDGKEYTSGMVETRDKFSFKYGRIEGRIRFPQQKGLLSAFWLLGHDGIYEEINIAELVGHENETIYGVNHYTENGRLKKGYGYLTLDDTDAFHVYTVEWTPEEIRWYVDDTLYFSSDKGIPQQDLYIILTLAVGGEWPGKPKNDTAFPCEMAVDYVRFYKAKDREDAS